MRSTRLTFESRPTISWAAIFLLLVLGPLGAQGVDHKVTIDWIYSPAPHAITAMPTTAWLPDGSLLLAEGGAWTQLNPETGESSAAVNGSKAILGLRSATGLPFEGVPQWEALSQDGTCALWNIDSKLVHMELATGRVRALTDGTKPTSNARLSPNGQKVAFTRGHDLYVHDISQGRTRRLTHDGSDTIRNGTLPWVYWEEIYGRQDLGYWWSPDGSKIAFLRSDESMVTEVTHLGFRGPVPRVIRQRYPKAGTANPVVRVGIIDVQAEDSKPQWVNLDGNDYEYLVRVKWLPKSDRVALQTLDRLHQNLELWFADAAGGEATKVLSESDPGWINIHDDLYFLNDHEHFLWVSERSGYAHLYRYRMDGTLVNQVTSGEWALKGATSIFWLRQAVMGIDETQGWVYFGALERDGQGGDLYRIKMDGSGMERLTEAPGTHRIKMAPTARHFLDEHSSINRPPALELCAANGTILSSLVEPRTALVNDLNLCTPELFMVPARDGFQMPAWIYKPHDFDPSKKYPVVLYTYGGPSSRSVVNEWDFDRYFNTVLAREGRLVVCIENRSATGISKSSENTITGMMTGDGELADLLDGVSWLKNQSYVDPARIGIWGWSNGGMMTLLAMTRSEEFKAGISVAPVTDWYYYDTIWAETVMKPPQVNGEGYERTNLWKRAGDLSGRLMLVHGTYDDNVHIQNTWHFVDELIRHNKMFDLMVYPMRKHGISDRAARVHLYNRMVEFWRTHL